MDDFNCQYCDYSSRHFYKLIKHLKLVHSYEHGFKVTCGINECRKSYKMVKKFVNHIRRKHKRFGEIHLPLRRNNAAALPDENEEQLDDEDDGDGLLEEHDEGPPDYRHLVSNIFLTAREEYKVSGKACEFIGQRLHQLLEMTSPEISEATEKYSIPRNFEKVAERSPNFVKPCKVDLGERNGKVDSYQYVPILQTLKALLKHDDILGQVLQGHKSDNGIIASYTDAQLFEESEFFQLHPDGLQIILYYDDFQITNPLRRRNQYKLGAFYFLLGNVHPKYRCKKKMVQLAALCKTDDLKYHGLAKVLSRLIADLKSLEVDGIQFSHDGSNFHIYGTLVLVVGDNLAQHYIGGFPENFSNSLRLCRFCNGPRDMVKTSINEADFTWRTKESYNEQANTVEIQPTLASVYGIKNRSPLNQLKYFHVIPSMPSDIAHDLFEGGVVSRLLSTIICELVTDRQFTLTDLNRRIGRFVLASCDQNNPLRPVPTQVANFAIKSTIAETWLFMRMLPLLIGDMVTEGDDVWGVFLDMLDMVELICASSYTPGEIAYMGEKIRVFHENFHEVFDTTLTPKDHFTLHYETQTRLFGPLVLCNTNLWERRHGMLKDIANRCKNRKDILLTLANRHQYYQYLQHESVNFIETDVQYVKGKPVSIQGLDANTQHLLAPQQQQNVYKAQAIVVNGTRYSTGCAVILSYEDDNYKFGQIISVIHASGTDFLQCTVMETLAFNRHFHAYEVKATEASRLVEIDNILDYHPLGIYRKAGKLFIVLKHFVSPERMNRHV